MICISCKTEFNTNFCPNCGEKSGIKTITFKSIMEDAFSTITNMDKGFLYNVKMLLIDPFTISTAYIQGKRKGVLNPISFLILSVTLYLVVESLFRVPLHSTGTQNPPDVYIGKVAYAAGKYVHSYFKYFWILSIIPLAIATKSFFRKYNFTEHLAINSFILGQATLIGLISYLIAKIDMPINPIVYAFILWSIYRVFITKNKLESFLMSLGALILFILLLGLTTIGIGVVMA